MNRISFIFLLFGLLLIEGCSANIETFGSTQSLGTQLEQLDKAYQANAITEKEYQKGKEILIDHYK
jgi:hypothetical protein